MKQVKAITTQRQTVAILVVVLHCSVSSASGSNIYSSITALAILSIKHMTCCKRGGVDTV